MPVQWHPSLEENRSVRVRVQTFAWKKKMSLLASDNFPRQFFFFSHSFRRLQGVVSWSSATSPRDSSQEEQSRTFQAGDSPASDPNAISNWIHPQVIVQRGQMYSFTALTRLHMCAVVCVQPHSFSQASHPTRRRRLLTASFCFHFGATSVSLLKITALTKGSCLSLSASIFCSFTRTTSSSPFFSFFFFFIFALRFSLSVFILKRRDTRKQIFAESFSTPDSQWTLEDNWLWGNLTRAMKEGEDWGMTRKKGRRFRCKNILKKKEVCSQQPVRPIYLQKERYERWAENN